MVTSNALGQSVKFVLVLVTLLFACQGKLEAFVETGEGSHCGYGVKRSEDGITVAVGAPLAWAVHGSWHQLECLSVKRVTGNKSTRGRGWSSGGHFKGWDILVGLPGSGEPLLRLGVHNYANWTTFSYKALQVIYPELGDLSQLTGSFPAFTQVQFDGQLSWQGSFVQPHYGSCSSGIQGGPCLFYNKSSPLQEVMMVSALDHFLTTSQSTTLWDNTRVPWGGGTSGMVDSLPANFEHQFVLVGSSLGITNGLYKWGQVLQEYHNTVRVPDVTISSLGYQTDNGAQYCFGCGNHCDQVLLDLLEYLRAIEVPVKYLSYQNAWWHTSGSAPWCVTDFDWVPSKVPMGVPEFHEKAGLPFQLYAPYFCEETPYASSFRFLSSDPSLPTCKGFKFKDPSPEHSFQFYMWFFQKGVSYGMTSFEADFMNQNLNCVPRFLQEIGAAEEFLNGMTRAAHQFSLSVQWCYATPSALLQALKYPVVTNFRGSFDYYYGNSWDIGGSSLLMWALGAAPSTDTFWTSDNGELATELGGCDRHRGCPEDHGDVGSQLHTILALMSTGPVGFSDAINHTNATRIRATCRDDGVLLQPNKPMTTLETFLGSPSHVLQSFSGPRKGSRLWAYYLLGHHLHRQQDLRVFLRELWPRPGRLALQDEYKKREWLLMRFSKREACQTNHAALRLCAETLDEQDPILFGSTSSSFEYELLTLVPKCSNGWAALGQVSKYAALSHSRIHRVSCLLDGISVNITGSVGETGTLSFASPDGLVLVHSFRIPTTRSWIELVLSDSHPPFQALEST